MTPKNPAPAAPIPMVDLKAQLESIRGEIEEGISGVLSSTQFILGPIGREVEEAVASLCGVRHALAVASGTDALHLAVRALGIGPGDEVITTPFTFIATAEAIAYVGATPVFVDIDPRTFNIDPSLVEGTVTERTRAVLPVHLFGQMADMGALGEICRRRGLALIEDCAQAFGARWEGRAAGAIGDAGCFSFFPSKNLGCYGDGGMITTDDVRIAERIRSLRNHGSLERYVHSEVGYNSRLDEIQAVVLRAKIRRIEEYNRRRQENAARYSRNLAGSSVVIPFEDGRGTHVYHQYTIQVPDRDDVHAALGRAGISSAVYYPIPLHRQKAFEHLCAGLVLPNAERAAARVLSLPMYPELTADQIDRVCETLLASIP